MTQLPDTNIQRAILDVAEIRRVLRRVEGLTEDEKAPSQVYLWIYGFFAGAAAVLLATEVLFEHPITSQMLTANLAWHHRFALVSVLAVLLGGLALLLSIAIWNASRKSDETFADFLSRSFIYLRNVSFVSDLYSKFAFLSVAILAGRGDWVAPIFVLCIGDYLLQGRLFILPTVASLLLGFTLLIVATVQLIWLPGSMLAPILALLIVSLLSFRYIRAQRAGIEAENHSGQQAI